MELYNGTFMKLRVLSDCICGEETPALDKSNPLLCKTNGDSYGVTRPRLSSPRKDINFYLPEMANDGLFETAWISTPGDVSVFFIVHFETKVYVSKQPNKFTILVHSQQACTASV